MKNSLSAESSKPRKHDQVKGNSGYQRSNAYPIEPSTPSLQEPYLEYPDQPSWPGPPPPSTASNLYNTASVVANQPSMLQAYETATDSSQSSSFAGTDARMIPSGTGNASQEVVTKLGQKGQQMEVHLRCIFCRLPGKPCQSIKRYNRDIIRHLYAHKFFFCPKCCRCFNNKAQLDDHSCGRASICVHLECKNRHGGPQVHNHQMGCPSSFHELDTKPKWYALHGLARSNAEPPSWDYVCVPADSTDGSNQSNIDDAGASNPDLGKLRPVRPEASYSDLAPTSIQLSRPVSHDNAPVNGINNFHNMDSPLSSSPMLAGGNCNLQFGQTQVDYPSQEFGVQSWTPTPPYEPQSFQHTCLSHPSAAQCRGVRAPNASNAPSSYAAEGWPGQYGVNFGDSYGGFPLTDQGYPYPASGASIPPQSRPSENDFEFPMVE